MTDHTFNDAQPIPERGNPEWFCHWLKGYLGAITGRDELDAFEANSIRNTLNEVIAAQPPAAPVETCARCGGSGLSLNGHGEPDECRECKGNTVVSRCSAVTVDRETAAKAIRSALTEEWTDADNCRRWDEDVLLTGCRKVGAGSGYSKPEEAAQNLALMAADAVLALIRAVPQEARK